MYVSGKMYSILKILNGFFTQHQSIINSCKCYVKNTQIDYKI